MKMLREKNCSKYNGENVIPITATQLISKNNEYRKIYGQFWKVNTIEKVENDGVNEPTAVVITPTTDMSEYV